MVELPRQDGKRRYVIKSLHTKDYYEALERSKNMKKALRGNAQGFACLQPDRFAGLYAVFFAFAAEENLECRRIIDLFAVERNDCV